MRFGGRDLPRRAEVEEHGAAVLANEDVARLDVAMGKLLVVQRLQGIQEGEQEAQDLVFRERGTPRQDRLQVLPLLIVHDEIGGVVGLEQVHQPHDVGMIEPVQVLGLRDEPPEARGVVVEEHIREGLEPLLFPAPGHLRGEVFLDRDDAPVVQVLGEVGGPEGALAQDLLDPIPQKLGALWQGVPVLPNGCHRGYVGDDAASQSALQGESSRISVVAGMGVVGRIRAPALCCFALVY